MSLGTWMSLAGACLAFTNASAETMPAKWKALLKTVAETNSGTGNHAGAAKVRKVLKAEFEKLGFKESYHPSGDGYGVTSYEIPGAKPQILFSGHVDTVFAPESPFQKVKEENDRLIGPGVIDMKGGVVLMLNVLADIKDKETLRKFRVILSDDEETLSGYGAKTMDELAKGIPYGLVFEPGAPGGALVTSHGGVHWIELSVKGKASHAGLSHPDGINACVELGDKISRISELTDYSRCFTVSPDVIKGGTKTNIVCEEASAQIDLRFNDKADLEAALKKIDKIRDESFVHNEKLKQEPKAEVKNLRNMMNMVPSMTDELYEKAQVVGKELGQGVKGIYVGYGTDAGHLAETGMKVLVGLGPWGDGLHTDHEYMEMRSYTERLQLTKGLVKRLLKDTP